MKDLHWLQAVGIGVMRGVLIVAVIAASLIGLTALHSWLAPSPKTVLRLWLGFWTLLGPALYAVGTYLKRRQK